VGGYGADAEAEAWRLDSSSVSQAGQQEGVLSKRGRGKRGGHITNRHYRPESPRGEKLENLPEKRKTKSRGFRAGE